jgi:hypothetical protein
MVGEFNLNPIDVLAAGEKDAGVSHIHSTESHGLDNPPRLINLDTHSRESRPRMEFESQILFHSRTRRSAQRRRTSNRIRADVNGCTQRGRCRGGNDKTTSGGRHTDSGQHNISKHAITPNRSLAGVDQRHHRRRLHVVSSEKVCAGW